MLYGVIFVATLLFQNHEQHVCYFVLLINKSGKCKPFKKNFAV